MNHSPAVVERVRNPQRVGSFPPGSVDVGTGEAGSLDQGTVARIQVRVVEGRVAEARFKVFGCSAAIASASYVAEHVEGLEPGAEHPDVDHVVRALALPEERRQVAQVAVDAARAAMADWRANAPGSRS